MTDKLPLPFVYQKILNILKDKDAENKVPSSFIAQRFRLSEKEAKLLLEPLKKDNKIVVKNSLLRRPTPPSIPANVFKPLERKPSA